MSDLIDEPGEGVNAPEFSVTEVSNAIKRVIEGEFGMVRVRGEVGRGVSCWRRVAPQGSTSQFR